MYHLPTLDTHLATLLHVELMSGYAGTLVHCTLVNLRFLGPYWLYRLGSNPSMAQNPGLSLILALVHLRISIFRHD